MLVAIHDLSKSYGKVKAVDGLSLEVREGSIMGLIGPNGAGKTTTMKILLGLLRPDRGKVEVFAQDPWDNPDIRSRIGAIYEKSYFPPHHKALDYLEKSCRIFGFPESRAGEMLEMVGLKGAHDRAIRGLSAGMLQKFAIAQALIHKPEFVVADEPTSNLDPQSRNDLLNLILRLHREEKTTFLISSHILPELGRICESVAVINNGKVWAQGSFAELCERFGVGGARVTTDKPELLAKEVKELKYVRGLSVETRGLVVDVPQETTEQLFEDVLKISRKVGARIFGMESGVTSLEELFRLAVQTRAEGGQNG